jgi:5'-nucleotidase / UDP-sugar diphosphatase
MLKLKSFFILCSTILLMNSTHAGYSQTCNLRILHTNDVHGRILPFELGISDYHKEVGGVARRATLVNNIRKQSKNTNVLLLDAGDAAQGTIFFNLYSGKPDIDYMNQLGYDAMTLGNHEFDKGTDILAMMLEDAQFPILAANLEFSQRSPLYGKVVPYKILEFNGCKVGIIGLVTDEIKIISNIGKHTTVLDPIKSAQKYIKKIDKDTDAIILLTHIGFDKDKILAANIKNADLIIGGHSHTTLYTPVLVKDKEGVEIPIVQVGDLGKYLGDVKAKIENDKICILDYKIHLIDSKIKPDKNINNQLKKLNSDFNEITRQVAGHTATHINLIRDEVRSKETTGGNFFVDAIKYKFPEADVVLQNGGAIRSDKIMPPGKISLADVMELHPFDNEVILFDLKGKDLKSVLERSVSSLPYSSGGFLQVSGLSFIADVSKKPQSLTKNLMKIKEEGDRISVVFVNGKPLNLNHTYRIASNIFLLNGGNGFWAMRDGATNIQNTGLTLTEVLVEYLKNNDPISPQVENRIKVINTPKKNEE